MGIPAVSVLLLTRERREKRPLVMTLLPTFRDGRSGTSIDGSTDEIHDPLSLFSSFGPVLDDMCQCQSDVWKEALKALF